MNGFLKDITFAFRQLWKNPGFTVAAMLTLALGIGANTAIFSLVDAVLLKMLPVENPDELVELGRGEGTTFSYPIFEQLRDNNQVFSDVLTVSKTPLHITDDAASESVEGQYVSGNYFTMLGVRALLGRTIIPQDDALSEGNDPQVTVLSHGFWQRRFGKDETIVGQKIMVEEKPFTVIGVAQPDFFGLQVGSAPGFWVPMAAEPVLRPNSWFTRIGFNWLSVVGRLKPNVTMEQARTNLDSVISNLILAQTASERGNEQYESKLQQLLQANKISVNPASNGLAQLRQKFSEPLMILMSIVGLVLLIACANIANLLLSRAESRRKEFAVRMAMGAGGARLLRQVLTESVLLAFMGGVAGLFFAFWCSGFLVALMSGEGAPIILALTPDIRVFAFTSAVSLLTGLLYGLAPALRAARMNVNNTLKESARSLHGGRPGIPLGKTLVVLQVSVTLALVFGAGLFVGSLRNLMSLDAGYDRENVLLTSVNPGKAGYQEGERVNYYSQLLNRVSQIPGVESAGFAWYAQVSRPSVDQKASIEGYVPQQDEDMTAYIHEVSPGYFKTMATPLLLGRDFNSQDTQESVKVALINESMMKRFFNDGNPVGRRVQFGDNEPVEIIGVVQDVVDLKQRGQTYPTVYNNCFQSQETAGSLTLAVRSSNISPGLIATIKDNINALSQSVPVTGFGTLVEQVDRTLVQERLVSMLTGFFGGLALLLACIGLYGVMSYNVTRRTNEIGIRMALGARRWDMTWLVLQESLLLVAVGVAIGVPIALTAARLFASQISGLLFELSPTDVRIIILAVIVLTGVGLFAGYLPARRAAKVDPMTALRCE